MKKRIINILILFTFLIPITNYAQDRVTTEELKILLGEWTGTLTYTDYSTNEPFTMPATLRINQGKNESLLILNITYPNEPNANSRDKIKLSKDGTQLNKLEIESKQILANGYIQVTTKYSGKDNGKEATIKNVYTIGASQFIIRKEVKFENSDDWLIRNEYTYTR